MLSLLAWCGSTNLENKLSKLKLQLKAFAGLGGKYLGSVSRSLSCCTSLANITLDANEYYTTTQVDMFRDTLKHVKIVVERHIEPIF